MQQWQPLTLDRALARNVSERPTAEALVYKGERITWAALDEWSSRLAAAFLANGVKRGDRVATFMVNSVEWAAIFLGLGKIGAVIVPVNFRYKAQELAYVLTQSGSSMLLATVRHDGRDQAPILSEALAEAKTPLVVTLGGTPALGAAARQIAWEAFVESASGVAKADLDAARARVEPNDLLMIQYTSGTTAFPKGVELRHDQMLRSGTAMSARLGLDGEGRFFSPMPFFHIGGSVASLLTALACGATLCFIDYFRAEDALDILEREKCTHMCGVDTMFVDMLAHESYARRDLSALRTGWTIYNEAVFAAFPGMMNVYAMSECSSVVCISHWSDPFDKRRDTCGQAIEGVEVRVVDSETHEDLAPGASGLILVKGWCVTSGYFNQPEQTAKAMLPGGWFNTGDYGRRTATGELIYQGRLKDVLRVGGENVAAVEVEALINKHPAVLRSALVPLAHPRLKEVPVAFVQLRPEMSVTEKDLIAWCAEKLASFKVPRHVVFVPEFQMTGSAKIQKQPLIEQARATLGA
ncbi:class I adenylate-forming enzyme family protein [Ramlibacter sp.]|uniref:class I adenylate-forming enzyme family protein n=1 Tax=Ramlibacter sp. TaxID=1917967 RepID=UPI003D0EBEB6